MLEQHGALDQALGARGAHVVMPKFVEEEGAVQARLRRNADHHRQHHRQRHEGGQVGPGRIAPTLHREPAELEAEHILADDDVNQERNRQRDRRHHHQRTVGERAAHIGHPDRDRDREQGVEDQDRDHHRQRRRHARGEQRRHRFIGGPALAPIESGDLLQEDPELVVPGLVQAELLPDRRDLLLRGVQAAKDDRRIAAEELEQHEDQHHHADQRGHHLPEAPDEISQHGGERC